jgi:hypothetical protein
MMELDMYLHTDKAMKAAAAGTGTPPDTLLATVEEAMATATAFRMALDEASVTGVYGLARVSVQLSSQNNNTIARCAAYVAKGRVSYTYIDGLSNAGFWALIIVVPVSVGLMVGLRLLFKIKARRRAAAAVAAAATTTSVPAINIGPMKAGAAAPAAAQPAAGVPYNGYSGSYSSAGPRASSPPAAVISPFAACQPGYAAYAAPAVGTAAAAGSGVHYGAFGMAGSGGHPAVQSPYSVAAARPAY